ncbi:MAG: ABC transporter ATP-binding protein [Hyphomicrobiales bacterium]|nr:ABC transporter ATP-binding protein [Hyphomicrobiales bacterium]
MSAPMLSVQQVSVDFATEDGTVHVLDGVSLAVGRGEIVGLVGESGCGKSTLARTILGVLPPHISTVSGGRVVFDGENLLDMPHRRLARDVRGRRITLIPQDPYQAFNPLFTVGTQIMDLMRTKSPAPGGLSGRARKRFDRDRVIQVLEAVNIPSPAEALKKLPHEFSGGQLQRLMIAMAFLPNPELIIADEPTTALDVTIQAQILRLLRNMADREGVAVIFTTHDLATAYQLCDRVVVMYAGQEMEDADTDSFFASPRHPYTYGLLGSIPGKNAEVREIPGEMANLADPPSGCRFRTRCARAEVRCAEARPPVTECAAGHVVRCFNTANEQVAT